jgi:hypothetical protein
MSASGTTPETVDAGEADSQPARYPTDKELRSSGVDPLPTLATARLFWSFSGSLETSFSVMATAYNIDVLEPYFQPAAGGDSPWHVISKSSLTHPPVSAIVVTVAHLEVWEPEWIDFHESHSDPYSHTKCQILQYGDLPDYDPEKDEDPPHLLVCCGTDRPRNKSGGVLVTASQSGPGFVTVHDYVTTVHPWLMRNRDDILDAMYCWETGPDPKDMDLVVDAVFPDWLRIRAKSEVVNELSYWRRRFYSRS